MKEITETSKKLQPKAQEIPATSRKQLYGRIPAVDIPTISTLMIILKGK